MRNDDLHTFETPDKQSHAQSDNNDMDGENSESYDNMSMMVGLNCLCFFLFLCFFGFKNKTQNATKKKPANKPIKSTRVKKELNVQYKNNTTFLFLFFLYINVYAVFCFVLK